MPHFPTKGVSEYYFLLRLLIHVGFKYANSRNKSSIKILPKCWRGYMGENIDIRKEKDTARRQTEPILMTEIRTMNVSTTINRFHINQEDFQS